MRKFLVRALQNAGFDVAFLDNGRSAYHRLREEPFELLLTDIVMPKWMASSSRAARRTETRSGYQWCFSSRASLPWH